MSDLPPVLFSTGDVPLGGPNAFSALVNLLVYAQWDAYGAELDRAAHIAVGAFGGPDNVQRLDWQRCGHSAFVALDHPLDRHRHYCPRCTAGGSCGTLMVPIWAPDPHYR